MSHCRTTLQELGEDALVEYYIQCGIKTHKKSGDSQNLFGKNSWVITGVGDDSAVLRTHRENTLQLLKVDAVVENVHFKPQAPPHLIGWKALARTVSDIAAMGGLPISALIALGTPPDTNFQKVKKIFEGICRCARKFGISLVGGDTTAAPVLFLTVTLSGLVERNKITLRSGAREGDAIMVTGTLGGSLQKKHLRFIPRITEARWLVENFKPTAMMDISDGLAKDLTRLAAANQMHAHVDLNAIPASPGCTLQQALEEGEDYELLFTIPQSKVKALQSKWPFRLPLTKIGFLSKKATTKKIGNGFDHFLQSRRNA